MTSGIRIKVCGMKYYANRVELETLPIDYFGFIFYPYSKRFVGDQELAAKLNLTHTTKIKVGIFVNEMEEKIIDSGKKLFLSHIQLHGDESPELCRSLREKGFKVIKAFRIDNRYNFEETSDYAGFADFFLFDTKAEVPGGTGKKYNWKMLEKYHGSTPFFLSGGIQPSDVPIIRAFDHPQFYGIDLNSGFEDAPGLKNSNMLRTFIDDLKKHDEV